MCTSPGSEAAGSKVMEALARLWTCEPQCEIRDLCQPKSQPYRGHAAPAQQLDSLQENREDPKPDAATENTKVIVALARLQVASLILIAAQIISDIFFLSLFLYLFFCCWILFP
eukprot:Tamp_24892.p1 GENE.Tamp_24892~~Tamp_24892.p1  ORF type:complete len:114 (-),score=9.58 Tamp_24892:157-498(-)